MKLNLDDLKVKGSDTPIVEVSLDDNTHVGDRMGFAHSTTLQTWQFANFDVASRFARFLIARIDRSEDVEADYQRLRQSFMRSSNQNGGIDLGAYGVNLRVRSLKIIDAFTYQAERTVSETVEG